MTFEETLVQVRELLAREGRVAYRILKRRFELSDDDLEDIKADLIDAKRLAVDEDGKVLVWAASLASSVPSLESATPNFLDARLKDAELRPPVSYTPAHLAERIRAVTVTDGERKTITALFADLKGSTALIESLDPEEARAIIDPALQLMMDAVHRYEGYVAQALGDGIFALFGAPLAHEDHPQRAVYAALRMQEEMRRYADALRQKGYPPLLMRVGLNTGEVVLRSIRKDDLHADYVPVGHSTNLAARMEQLATPGAIVVSAYTHRFTDGYFAFTDLGPTPIKGVAESLNIYEVQGVGPLRTRLQVSARRGLTRFVGRQSEMEQLHHSLDQAKAGHGQLVGVMGEPGLGKSRLFYEFKLLSLGGCLTLEAYAVSHGKGTAYLPVIELLKSYFDIQAVDDARKRREKVAGKVVMLDRSLEDVLPYLFALLDLEEQPSPLQQMDPQIRRRRTLDALKKLFLRESLNQPLVLIFEDLHWIDGETQGFLDALSESIASAKILLLTNYRPEYRHEWGQKTYSTQLRLAPLGQTEAEDFLDALLGQSPLPSGERDRARGLENDISTLKRLILDKTQGTPFFMEEMVQELVEQGVLIRNSAGTGLVPAYEGAHRGAPLHIPATVQGILAARIDRLEPEEKALLQQLSIIGRQFPLSLVRHIVPQSEADLYRLLASLQRKEFLYEQPAFPESEYIFKHALTQDVAYGAVLQEQRKLLHAQTAQALEQLYEEKLSEHYDDLAYHYRRSANTEKAVQYLQLAGQQAAQRSANTEAIDQLSTALDLLAALPDTRQRAQQELVLRTSLGPLLMTTKGWAGEEVGAMYARARELCRQLGETSQLFPVMRGLCTFHIIRAEIRLAQELVQQLPDLADKEPDSGLRVEAHLAAGASAFWFGDFTTARRHLQEGLSHYNTEQHRSHLVRYGRDSGVFGLDYLARTLWLLGYPTQALQKAAAMFSLAGQLAHPFSFAWAYNCCLYVLRREWSKAQECAEAVIAISTQHGFSAGLPISLLALGETYTSQGKWAESIAQIQQSMSLARDMGAGMVRSASLTQLAAAYAGMGQRDTGLALFDEALALVQNNEEHWYEAETYRIKGELLLTQEGKSQKAKGKSQKGEDAEACFLKAIAVAQQQQAKSWELRASMSLARLWQQQGKQHAARTMLSTIYHWFTEGFDTADLRDAKALLEELKD